MGYRISYDHAGKTVDQKRKHNSGVLAVFLVVLLVFGAVTVKKVGLDWVQEVLLPGDPAVTAAALEGMVQDLKEGTSLTEAVTVFCQEIIKGAQ